MNPLQITGPATPAALAGKSSMRFLESSPPFTAPAGGLWQSSMLASPDRIEKNVLRPKAAR